MEDHWPSLPPIRTSSHNSRVICETLNIHTSPPASSSNPHSSYNTPFSHPPSSSSQTAATTADASSSSIRASSTTTTSSHFFSHCLPCRFASPKAAISAATSPGKEGKRAGAGGACDSAPGLLRSIVGFPAAAIPRYTSPMAPFSTGIAPSNTVSPSGRMKMVASVGTISPSGRMKPGAATTPHSGMQMRGSKGHGAANAFTMMPPDVVGKKKPPDYESDEPTSPEVTCMGRVRRKKPTWDALVKDEQKNHGRKKGRVKKLAAEFPRKSDFIQAVKQNEEDESTMAAKMSKQRSGRRKLHEFEGFQNEWGVEKLNHGQEKLNHSDLRTVRHNVEGLNKQFSMESLDEGFKELGNSDQIRGSMVFMDWDVENVNVDPSYVDWDVENATVDPSYGNADDSTNDAGHQSNDQKQSSSRTATDSEWQDEDSTDSQQPSEDENTSCQHHEELIDVASCDTTEATAAACVYQTVLPPPNCLLLMRKGSTRRSERRSCDELLSSVYEHGHKSNHNWNWGQVLT